MKVFINNPVMSRYLVKDTNTNITHFHVSSDMEYYLENNPHIKLLKDVK